MQPRLFVPCDLSGQAAVALTSAQAHYLRNVLRLQAGVSVRLFNGRDGEWEAVLQRLDKQAVAVARAQRRAQRSEADAWLACAPIKGPRWDLTIEKATELGVARIVPVQTRRTVVTRLNLDRLRAHAVEAAEQCERLTVPVIDAARPLSAVLQDWPADRRLYVADESGAGTPVGEVAAAGGPWAVLVGPEGGFTQGELDALHKTAFVTSVSLGPRILRADTAAVAALAALQSRLGDWSTPLVR